MIRTGTTIAAALATLAIAAPFATARPIDAGYTAPTVAAPTVAAQDEGFDWFDAAIGAAVAAGVFSLTGAGVLVARRPGEDANAPLGAH